MIRLNAFFELKDNISPEQVKSLAKELVDKSRKDNGNVSYDLFQSATNSQIMMFCETWKDDAVLEVHSKAPHFTTIVPQIEALTKHGLKLERFEF